MVGHSVGVDWSSGSWVTVTYADEGNSPDVRVFDTMQEVWDAYGDSAKRIVVDVPIGLCESRDAEGCPCERDSDDELSRQCDDLARTVIGPRSSSVFTAPARGAAKLAVNEGEYKEVNQENKRLTGKGLTRQAASISEGIVEVEDLLLDGGEMDVLVEGHPEVCFRAFNDGVLQHSKKTAPGVDERLEALESVPEYETGDWRELCGSLRGEDRKVQVDDLLDALALAQTALADEEEFQRLPQEPPDDSEGLPMEMVYRRDNPFERER